MKTLQYTSPAKQAVIDYMINKNKYNLLCDTEFFTIYIPGDVQL